MIIITVCSDGSDQINTPRKLALAKTFISQIRAHLLRTAGIKIGRIYLKYRTVAEIEFLLANPGDHAFGLFSGYEFRIKRHNINLLEIKRMAMKLELDRQERIADIDVYWHDTKTKELRKQTRYRKKTKLITKNYKQAA